MKNAWSYHSISGENWDRKVERVVVEREALDQLWMKVSAIWEESGEGELVVVGGKVEEGGEEGEERVVGNEEGGAVWSC